MSASPRRAFVVCAAVTVVLLWAQFLLTSRFAGVPGSLHGPKRLLYLVVLSAATVALLVARGRSRAKTENGRLSTVALAGGSLSIIAACVIWFFPPAHWTGIPYLDNWTTRYLSTIDGIDLLKQGAAVGWNWDFLGGYHTASDITQSLTLVALVPVLLFGNAVGFHLAHVLMFLAIPALVYVDLRLDDDRRLAALGAGLSAIGAASMSYLLMRSGDTNSLAGVVMTVLALMAAHAAAVERRWGAPLLVVTMAMAAWSHAGFFLYGCLFLLIDAAVARDRRRAVRAVVAGVAGAVASLPFSWELFRYPEYFIANNVILDRHFTIDWMALARKLFYNVELLWLPGRWLNDFAGLTHVFLPLVALAAWRGRGRARFYAVAALSVMALTRLQSGETAYVFVRPMYLVAVFTPVAIACIIDAFLESGWRRWTIALLAVVYLQIWWAPVPHRRGGSFIEPELIAHMRGLDGALVLFENTPHRDMNADPAREIEPAPVPVHFESIVPRLTGLRLYAGMWDGWQWCPQRDEVLAGGAFRGASISVTPNPSVHAELTRWGVRHLVVWSKAATRFSDSDPAFVRRWSSGPWVHYEFASADPRDVIVQSGSGRITARTSLGAQITLEGVRRGDRVTLRTHYYPAWTAWMDGTEVPLVNNGEQLAFDAPRDGTYSIELRYPKRIGLLLVGIGAVIGGVLTIERVRRGR